jgi:2'-hydroxyisoflavone reductase
VISSVSAYDVPEAHGFDETSRLLDPTPLGTAELTGETYGRLKVAVEDVVLSRYGARATVVRPTYVVGPFDHTGRFTYWVERIAEGGEVLAPGDPTAPTQVIDGRDMGAWIVRLLEDDVPGVFHAVSPAPPYGFGDLLRDVVEAVGPEGTTLTWVDGGWLLEQGEDGASLPLWGEDDPAEAMLAADPSRAYGAGLAPRPIADTIRDTLASARADVVSAPPRALAGRGAISREREAELLAAWHARTP